MQDDDLDFDKEKRKRLLNIVKENFELFDIDRLEASYTGEVHVQLKVYNKKLMKDLVRGLA